MQRRESQEQPTGVIINDEESFKGYTLLASINSTMTYLIDNEGRIINTWKSDYRPAHSVYLLKNGHLLRTGAMGLEENSIFRVGGSGGHVQEFTWDGELVWDYVYASDKYLLHHDIEYMPNGNILMIAWETKTRKELIEAGRNPELITERGMWVDHVIEVKPTGKTSGDVIWEWHMWDHIVQDFDSSKANYGDVAKHPELLDLNYTPRRGRIHEDWNHTNSIDYNPKLDQILLCLHTMSEIFVIDHSTTTDEAQDIREDATTRVGTSCTAGVILRSIGRVMRAIRNCSLRTTRPGSNLAWMEQETSWYLITARVVQTVVIHPSM